MNDYIESVIAISQDSSEIISSRTSAIKALGQLAPQLLSGAKKSNVIKLLIELLEDDNRDVCSTSAMELVKLGAKDATPQLLHVYETGKLDALAYEEVRKFLSTSRIFSSVGSIIPDVVNFVGRAAELHTLKKALNQSRIVAIVGIAGIGKTALAAKYTQQANNKVKIWLSCTSQSDLADLAFETLRQANMWVSLTPERAPFLTENLQVFEWQLVKNKIIEMLTSRSTLLVIDSYEAFSQERDLTHFIRTLVDELPDLQCLITGRQTPDKIIDTIPILNLLGLNENEAALLFEKAAALSFPLKVNNIHRLVSNFQGHPLALKLAAQLPIEQRESIFSDQARISLTSITDILDHSLKQLDITQRRALEVIAQFDEPINPQAPFLVELFELELANPPSEILQSLLKSSLISSDEEGSIIVHGVVRQFILENTDLRTSLRINQAIATYYQQQGNIVRTTTHLIRADAPAEAIKIITQNLLVIVNRGHAALIQQLLRETLGKSTLQPRVNMQFNNAVGYLSELLGDYHRASSSYENALHFARLTEDRIAEGKFLGNLGKVYSDLSRHRDAIQAYQQALAIARENGDPSGECNALNRLGEIFVNLKGDHTSALEMYEQALAIALKIDDRSYYGAVIKNLGTLYLDLGESQRAIEYFERALIIAREKVDRRSEGSGLSNLGMAYSELGESQRAIEYFEQALIIAREIGDRRSEALTLWSMSLTLDRMNLRPHAIAQAEAALKILKEIQHPIISKIREKLYAWQDV